MDRVYLVAFRSTVDDYYLYVHAAELYNFLVKLRSNAAVILFMFSEEMSTKPDCMANLLALAKEESQRIGAKISFP